MERRPYRGDQIEQPPSPELLEHIKNGPSNEYPIVGLRMGTLYNTNSFKKAFKCKTLEEVKATLREKGWVSVVTESKTFLSYNLNSRHGLSKK